MDVLSTLQMQLILLEVHFIHLHDELIYEAVHVVDLVLHTPVLLDHVVHISFGVVQVCHFVYHFVCCDRGVRKSVYFHTRNTVYLWRSIFIVIIVIIQVRARSYLFRYTIGGGRVCHLGEFVANYIFSESFRTWLWIKQWFIQIDVYHFFISISRSFYMILVIFNVTFMFILFL